MTKELTAPQFQLPDFVQKNLPSIDLAGGLSSAPPRISLRNSRFNFVENGSIVETVQDPYLKVVFVGAAPTVQRAFYAGAYDPSASALPDCMSEDGQISMGTGRQSETCHGCPQNTKQADPKRVGKEYTPCSFFKTLAVIPIMQPELKVYSLRLSSMTLFSKDNDPANNSFGLKPYTNHLAAKNLSPLTVITALVFNSNETVPVLRFSLAGIVGYPVQGAVDYTEEKYVQVMEFVKSGVEIKEAISLPTVLENPLPPKTVEPDSTPTPAPAPTPDTVADPTQAVTSSPLTPPITTPGPNININSPTPTTPNLTAPTAALDTGTTTEEAVKQAQVAPQGASVDAFIEDMKNVAGA